MHLAKIRPAQFFGIEINTFAVKVLKVCFLLAELKISRKLIDISVLDNNIITANALRMDWNELLPSKKCSYIISNPPFLGAMRMTIEQKKEIREIFKKVNGAGEFDYVTAWYKKSCDYMGNSNINTAFVSTNSLCQGEHVTNFWKYLLKNYPVEIDFAYKTFIWNSESKNCPHVYCVIVSFSRKGPNKKKILYENNKNFKECNNINPYLVDAPTEFISARSSPICDVPKMKVGNMPRDGGNLILTSEEKDIFIKKEPLTKKYIRPYIGAKEFINGTKRYCLWLKDAALNEIAKSKLILKRLIAVKKFREDSRAAGTRKYASVPALFCHISQPRGDYTLIPCTSASKRKYLPIGFVNKQFILSDAAQYIPIVSLYCFGILTSSTHMNWMRTVCGRLKSDYRYSKDIVYNTFPWPNPTESQKEDIEKTAKIILDARKLYPNCTLAQLYDPLTMPPELRKAHKLNDEAVLQAYGFNKNITEEECVAKLMEMYKELVEKENKKDVKK